jgi:hypothetical protein
MTTIITSDSAPQVDDKAEVQAAANAAQTCLTDDTAASPADRPAPEDPKTPAVLSPTADPLGSDHDNPPTGLNRAADVQQTPDSANRPQDVPVELEALERFAATHHCKIDPIVFAFPPMTHAEYQTLKESVRREKGLHLPIETSQGKIIDGFHRLRACQELGIKPRFAKWSGGDSLVEHVAALNAGRRQLTPSQRAAAAVELLPQLREEAKERQREHAGTAPGRSRSALPENFPEVFKGDARAQVAKLCGCNAHYVSDLEKVKKKKPELFAKVKSGAMTVNAAVKALKPSQPPPSKPNTTGSTTPVVPADAAGGQDGGHTPGGERGQANGASPETGKSRPADTAAPSTAPLEGHPPAASPGPEEQAGSTKRNSEGGSSGDAQPRPEAAPKATPKRPVWVTVEELDQWLTAVFMSCKEIVDGVCKAERQELLAKMDPKRRKEHQANLTKVAKQLSRLIDMFDIKEE